MSTAHGRHNKTKTTVGAAASSAADTQTEDGRLSMTSQIGYNQDIHSQNLLPRLFQVKATRVRFSIVIKLLLLLRAAAAAKIKL